MPGEGLIGGLEFGGASLDVLPDPFIKTPNFKSTAEKRWSSDDQNRWGLTVNKQRWTAQVNV